MNEKLTNALCRLGEAAVSLARCYQACADAVAAIFADLDLSPVLKYAKVQASLKEAPPRVRHLALYHKKRRVRKKYINRALRDYERSRPNGKD